MQVKLKTKKKVKLQNPKKINQFEIIKIINIIKDEEPDLEEISEQKFWDSVNAYVNDRNLDA